MKPKYKYFIHYLYGNGLGGIHLYKTYAEYIKAHRRISKGVWFTEYTHGKITVVDE